MRTAVVLVALAIAATACAGTNPGVKIYVSFDLYGPPVHSIETDSSPVGRCSCPRSTRVLVAVTLSEDDRRSG